MIRNLFSILMLCMAFCVYAQRDNDTTYINPKNFLLEELIISANRANQNLREVPHRVAKIVKADIERQNPQTAADLLGLSNQVFIQKSQLGGGSPMVRGFATNRVLLVVDGVRMNNAIFRSGNVQNVISLDANNIANVEVVFGPGSVIYGSDAIGGVMNFQTISPDFSDTRKTSFEGNAFTRYASANNENTGHLDFSIKGSKLAFLTSITHSDYDDLRMGSHGRIEYTRPFFQRFVNGSDQLIENPDPDKQVESGYSQYNLMQKVRYKPSEGWDLTYAFQYSRTSSYPRYDRLILTNSDGSLANGDWYYGPQKWSMHSLSGSFDRAMPLADHTRFAIGYQNYDESRHNRAFGSNRRTNRFENVKAYSLNIDMDKKISHSTVLYYGGEWIENDVGSTAFRRNIVTDEITPASTRYPDGADWRTYAAYGHAKTRIGHRWMLNLSARITRVETAAAFDTTFFDFPFTNAKIENTALNGSVGLVFNPTEEWKWFANLSTGFRSPNVDDIGKVFDSEPGNVVVPNPNLDPERAYNTEVGVTGNIVQNLAIDIAMFYTTLENAIARGPSTFNGQDSILFDGVQSRVLSLQNISRTYVYGTQIGLRWKMDNKWSLSSQFNFQDGKEKDTETGRNFSPTHVAPLFGAIHLIYKSAKIVADLYANYNGSISFDNLALSERADVHLYARDANGNPFAPGWTTLNLKLGLATHKNIMIDAGVENILDKRYRPYSSGISAAGRNVIISIRGKI